MFRTYQRTLFPLFGIIAALLVGALLPLGLIRLEEGVGRDVSALAAGLLAVTLAALLMPATPILLAAVAAVSNSVYANVPIGQGEYIAFWKILIGVFVASWVVSLARRTGTTRHPRRAEVALIIFVIDAFASAWVSQDLVTSLRVAAGLPFCLALALGCAGYVRANRRQAEFLLKSMSIAAVASAVLGLGAFTAYFMFGSTIIPGLSISGDPSAFFIVRVSSLVGDANFYGSYLAGAIGVTLAFFITSRSRYWGLATIVLVVTEFLTFSRGSWLGATAVLAFAAVVYARRRLSATVLLAGLAVTSVGLLLESSGVLRSILQERLSSISYMLYESPGSRISLWQAAVTETLSSPQTAIFGLGPGSIADWARYGISSADTHGRTNVLHVHNIIVEVFTAQGIVGATLFMFALLDLGVQAVRRCVSTRFQQHPDAVLLAGLLACIGTLVSDMSLNGLLSPWLWVNLGLCAGALTLAENSIAQRNESVSAPQSSASFQFPNDVAISAR